MSSDHATSNISSSNGAAVNPAVQNAANVIAESEYIVASLSATASFSTNRRFVESAAAYDAVASHPLTQNVKDTVIKGPVAENVKAEAAKTSNEFSNLSASRTTPSTPAATGQHLTHYHSFFSSLLSWDHPRASGIAYVSVVLFILGARYLNLLRLIFKLTWMTLGVTVAAEAVGKGLFSSGFTSTIRPAKYYVVPKDTLDALIGDVHELINFFVIESQRIVFAENVYASAAAFLGAFISYYLIKVVPFWGLSLIGTSTLFLGPLVYKTNKEFIDEHLRNASDVVVQQHEQIKEVATRHASIAAETTKQYAADYSAKAQEMIQARTGRSVSPSATKTSPAPVKSTIATESAPIKSEYKKEDFPAAPQQPFVSSTPIANEFVSAPNVGDSAKALRDENEPLLA